MKTVIFGSEGNVAKRLKTIFPDNFGVDRVEGADLVAAMDTLDYDAEAIFSGSVEFIESLVADRRP